MRKKEKTGEKTDKRIMSDNLPLELYGIITQIMLFVNTMDEDYTLRSIINERK